MIKKVLIYKHRTSFTDLGERKIWKYFGVKSQGRGNIIPPPCGALADFVNNKDSFQRSWNVYESCWAYFETSSLLMFICLRGI